MVDSSSVKLNSDSFEFLEDRLRYNKVISAYYDLLADEEGDGVHAEELYERISDRVDSCCTIWDVDYFRLQRTKVIVKTNRCRDKFCVQRL